jgi:hypothetical protein
LSFQKTNGIEKYFQQDQVQCLRNTENFIREEKYGYDLKHFPCLALNANYAFAQLAVVAHNLLRWIALVQKPDKPHFSKKIRRRYVYIPGKVIRKLCFWSCCRVFSVAA